MGLSIGLINANKNKHNLLVFDYRLVRFLENFFFK